MEKNYKLIFYIYFNIMFKFQLSINYKITPNPCYLRS